MINPNLKSQHDKNAESSGENEVKQFAQDNIRVIDFLLAFIDDFSHHLPLSVYSSAAQAKDKATMLRRFNSEGLMFATKALPLLSEGLFQFLESGIVSYPSFKIKRDTVHPEFLSGLFRLACHTGEYQVTAVRLIYQLSVCFSKLKGPYPESVLSKQYADFVSTDMGLADIDWFSDVNFPILEQARIEIESVFKNTDIDSLVKPRPGPGATNTPVAKNMRYRPHVLYTQVNDVIDYIDMYNVNAYDVVHQTKFWLNLYDNQVQAPRSRYKVVFKKFGKGRGICIEESEVQFIQQAYRRALYQIIESCPLTRGRINFSDQSINACLALLASWTGQMGTLDLSEASDRNARELVSWTFQNTEIHDALMALSTRYVDFPKESGVESLRTFKFAPMGSALCFPVMSLLYWALCRAIIHCSMLSNTLKKDVYVYGDDIVVPSPAVSAVLTYLPRFGMKVNNTKSFYRSGFRESCGVHAFNGVNITPVYVKHIPVTDSVSFLVSCIAVEAQMYKAGYRNVARLFRDMVCDHTGPLPYVSEDTSLLGFKRAGVFAPVTVGSVRSKCDEWGNPIFKFRVVRGKGAEKLRPPTDNECYLRERLTSAQEKEIGGKPDEFLTRWQYLRLSQISGAKLLEIPALSSTHYLLDARTPRDVYMENLYENLPELVRRESHHHKVGKANYKTRFVNRPQCLHCKIALGTLCDLAVSYANTAGSRNNPGCARRNVQRPSWR